ncbi:MAG: glycoside hydrolase family 43 protein [Bacteroidota bacterium]|nr:glycoside hydrolase family 43 protein [Bacteroidota bacterium]
MPVKLHILFFIVIIAFTACGKNNNHDTVTPPADTTPVRANTFTNPLLLSGPDPWVAQKEGYYYYTHTLGNKIALWKTDKMDELNRATPVTVWNAVANSDYSADVWAPELHFINNKWYLYFAADNGGDNSTHRIYVLENESADPTTGTWTLKGKLTDATNKWAIDASVFTYNNNNYLIWSGWQGDRDGEQDIFIAQLSNPYTVSSARVLISKPTYDWETRISGGVNVTVNEGPEALQNADGNLFISFSAGGCWSDDYCIGLLTLRNGGDPLNAADWTKGTTPVFTKNTSGNAYAPGHNGFFTSPDGKENWIIYHANSNSGQGCGDARSPRAQQFTWNKDGSPNFGSPVSLSIAITKPSGE